MKIEGVDTGKRSKQRTTLDWQVLDGIESVNQGELR